MAVGLSVCSANDLMNKPNGKYRELFRKRIKELSEKKVNRYTAKEIIAITAEPEDYEWSAKSVESVAGWSMMSVATYVML